MHDKMTIGSIVQLTETGVEQRIDFMGEITRRFAEVSQRQMEVGLRKKLIELGWTPPGTKRAGLLCIDSGKAAVVERHDFIPMPGYRNVWIIDAEPAA